MIVSCFIKTLNIGSYFWIRKSFHKPLEHFNAEHKFCDVDEKSINTFKLKKKTYILKEARAFSIPGL